MSTHGLLLIKRKTETTKKKINFVSCFRKRGISIQFTVNTDNKNGLLEHYHFSIPLCKVLLKIKVNIQSSYINIKVAHVFSSEQCCENK